MTIVDWIVFVLFMGSLVWAIDRHLCLKDVEKDLNMFLGDLLVDRDSESDKRCVCCRQAFIYQIKALIKHHFKA